MRIMMIALIVNSFLISKIPLDIKVTCYKLKTNQSMGKDSIYWMQDRLGLKEEHSKEMISMVTSITR
jgi:hypothetical protein